jgi:hypothetical protein
MGSTRFKVLWTVKTDTGKWLTQNILFFDDGLFLRSCRKGVKTFKIHHAMKCIAVPASWISVHHFVTAAELEFLLIPSLVSIVEKRYCLIRVCSSRCREIQYVGARAKQAGEASGQSERVKWEVEASGFELFLWKISLKKNNYQSIFGVEVVRPVSALPTLLHSSPCRSYPISRFPSSRQGPRDLRISLILKQKDRRWKFAGDFLRKLRNANPKRFCCVDKVKSFGLANSRIFRCTD